MWGGGGRRGERGLTPGICRGRGLTPGISRGRGLTPGICRGGGGRGGGGKRVRGLTPGICRGRGLTCSCPSSVGTPPGRGDCASSSCNYPVTRREGERGGKEGRGRERREEEREGEEKEFHGNAIGCIASCTLTETLFQTVHNSYIIYTHLSIHHTYAYYISCPHPLT